MGPAAGAPAFDVRAPAIELPKGGGAIRGIGETVAANPVTGTASLTLPIPVSPGRSGFGPQLALSYDSGAGNGPFGLGWSLSLPAITRKTDRGLPRYQDEDDSDVFLLSGAEDLVPVLNDRGERHREARTDVPCVVERYRPRIEGVFARIERWTNLDSGEIHWRSISRDNVTTLYGRTAESRIADPQDPARVFSWLICGSYDDRGSAIAYTYAAETSTGINGAAAHERNRTPAQRSANRYVKRIRYGNRRPNRDDTGRPTDPSALRDWMFEVVFDYGEGHYTPLPHDRNRAPTQQHARVRATAETTPPKAAGPVRPDPFSTYRAGFEVRTYRRCQRILLFHHFPNELGVASCLVRSTAFDYGDLVADRPVPVDQELAHQGSTSYVSILRSVTQSGYLRESGDVYLTESLPPLDLGYSRPVVSEDIEDVQPDSLDDLPQGLDAASYRWVDLDGEGAAGILTEQGGAWYYKRNLSALPLDRDGPDQALVARFTPAEPVQCQPSLTQLSAGGQLLDLAGDGQTDLVQLDRTPAGFYERTAVDWTRFVPFGSFPNLPWQAGQLQLLDLSGDGLADVLVAGDDVLTWHPSLGEAGFSSGRPLVSALDEEHGPTVVHVGATGSFYAADLSGDGLSDLVRIRNGEICYWPNLGYGRFGAKVSMDNAPWFDRPDLFEARRIRLADIDGSGVTDIVYLGNNGVRLYLNQSGNRWSDARTLVAFPPVDDLSTVVVIDLLGTGTACLVWSSPLPADARRPMRYVDLMGGRPQADGARGTKPHLLVTIRNNLGAETTIGYAPSTKFAIADRLAGTPWATHLPFPVHCVERVEVTDKWRQTSYASSYSYHHGFYDGTEREFRGFGRVEQVDVESFGRFTAGNVASPYVTEDENLYQPPVKTVTWFSTGASEGREGIRSRAAEEYFPRWLDPERSTPDLGGFRERALPEPDLSPSHISGVEWREALRACKGMKLRQETYELDVDALERGEQLPVRLFSASQHGWHVRRLQPRAGNRHAVFLVTNGEVVTYHYELNLTAGKLRADPRVTHVLNLRVDEYGNTLQSVSAVYPRHHRHVDARVPQDADDHIAAVQGEGHLVHIDTRYTDDVDGPDDHRVRVPCEVITSEVSDIEPEGSWFTVAQLRAFRLSQVHQLTGIPVAEVPYHQPPTGTGPRRRALTHVRTLFYDSAAQGPLVFRRLGRLGLAYETYKLALTGELLHTVFGDRLTADVRAALDEPGVSGYLGAAEQQEHFGDEATSERYWLRSGIVAYQGPFTMPARFADPFGNVTTLVYDRDSYAVVSTEDPVGNTVQVLTFDHRVLAPREVVDVNGNRTETRFDILGRPAVTAVKGGTTGDEGDHLDGLTDAAAIVGPAARSRFFDEPHDEEAAAGLLGTATTCHVLDLGARRVDGVLRYAQACPAVATISREQHVAALVGGGTPRSQVAIEYSCGMGDVLLTKSKAEPVGDGKRLRWVTSGKTVVNNKGMSVKQYEPFFSDHHHCQEAPEVGVATVRYYDAVGREMRTDHPDGSFSRNEFSPWHTTTYDRNDTVLEPGHRWYEERSSREASEAHRRAAELTTDHADTPSTTYFDSLGRAFISVIRNRIDRGAGASVETSHTTITGFDVEGHPLWVRDARGNLVMQYVTPAAPDDEVADPASGRAPAYDLAGNLLFEHSMDAGDRWMLHDATGQPLFAWDVNDRGQRDGSQVLERRSFHTTYDRLRRPLEHRLRIGGDSWQVIERYAYGEPQSGGPTDGSSNLRGQVHRHWDASGLLTNDRFDFKGNLLEETRRLASTYDGPVIDWTDGSATAQLEDEIFTRFTEFDALNRMVRQYNWHPSRERVAVYEARYNERGLLSGEDVTIGARLEVIDGRRTHAGGSKTTAIERLAYDAKGQRTSLKYGSGAITRYSYDRQTFRLVQLRTTRPDHDPPFPQHRSSLRDEQVLQQLHYTYDPVGNITEVLDEAHEPVFFRNQHVEARSRYRYDALYRLVEASGRESDGFETAPPQLGRRYQGVVFPITDRTLRNYTQTVAYDPVGNIETMAHAAGPRGSWTRHYEYADDSNRLLHTTTGAGPAVSYRYDTHGNMLNLNRVPDEFLLRWDHRDMIHSVDLGGGGRAYYSYDAAKQRTRKVIANRAGAIRKERLYLGGMEVYRTYHRGEVVEYVESHHLFVGGERVLLVEDVRTTENRSGSGTLYRYQLNDHLGSSHLEIDQHATEISYETYHPYGSSAFRAHNKVMDTSLKRYRYTGMERDGETGLSHHTYRHYAPWLGRWCSADPSGLADGVNLYRYAENNPIASTDTTGLQASSGSTRQRSTQDWRRVEVDNTSNAPPANPQVDTIMASVEAAARPLYVDVDRSMEQTAGLAGSLDERLSNTALGPRTRAEIAKTLIRMHGVYSRALTERADEHLASTLAPDSAPLAGIAEDVSPFGNIDVWVATVAGRPEDVDLTPRPGKRPPPPLPPPRPLNVEGFSWGAMDAAGRAQVVRRELGNLLQQQVTLEVRRTPWVGGTGEARLAEWNPVRQEALGFAIAIEHFIETGGSLLHIRRSNALQEPGRQRAVSALERIMGMPEPQRNAIIRNMRTIVPHLRRNLELITEQAMQ